MKNIFKHKAFHISLNVLFYTIIVLLVLFALANIKVKKVNNIANIFGYGFLSVQSNSMSGELEDSFEKGDLIFVKMLSEESRNNLKVGDIVTYYDVSIRAFNTHRIVEIDFEEEVVVTQADTNPTTNEVNSIPDKPIGLSQVISIYQSSQPNLGSTLDYMQSPTGFALIVIVPVALIFLYEGIILVKNIVAINREKIENKYKDDLQKTHELLEIEKEKIKQELIRELKNQENV
ncbi:MAG: signal peptidase I [Acholeplasmataceae bacterium]|jgi:signal peptidase